MSQPSCFRRALAIAIARVRRSDLWSDHRLATLEVKLAMREVLDVRY